MGDHGEEKDQSISVDQGVWLKLRPDEPSEDCLLYTSFLKNQDYWTLLLFEDIKPLAIHTVMKDFMDY